MNRLSKETSPYLLQHKDNPVDWYPWGEEAFLKAKAEDKPIFLSIGYSTCYWCHMMEKDSFEDQKVAEIINSKFIPIKVDREERPDVDAIYMEAVLTMTGHGGWPMSVFLTPDLRPMFAGTFFWKDYFTQLLAGIEDGWKNRREEVGQSVNELFNILNSFNEPIAKKQFNLSAELMIKGAAELRAKLDEKWGGFIQGGRVHPKFPQPQFLSLLARAELETGDGRYLEALELTLQKMAYGGIFDHVEGGFSRYSTDQMWLAPHFEKMLYDNAQLLCSYLEAYQITQKEIYKDVAIRTADFLIESMSLENKKYFKDSASDALISAFDAGRAGKEGEYYVFSYDQIAEEFSAEELSELSKYYDISEHGNFEGHIIIAVRHDQKWWTKKDSNFNERLLKLRKSKNSTNQINLEFDDKVISSWNGLAISALAKAGIALGNFKSGESRYLDYAKKIAEYLAKYHFDRASKKICRSSTCNEGRITVSANYGVLDDYVFFIRGLIDLYKATLEKRYLDLAIELQQVQNDIFYDPKDGSYFYSDARVSELIIRRKEFDDGAEPSSNGVSANNLIDLYFITKNEEYLNLSSSVVNSALNRVEGSLASFASTLIAAGKISKGGEYCTTAGVCI